MRVLSDLITEVLTNVGDAINLCPLSDEGSVLGKGGYSCWPNGDCMSRPDSKVGGTKLSGHAGRAIVDYASEVSVRCPPPNGAVSGALVSTIDSGHLGALYGGKAEEAALAG